MVPSTIKEIEFCGMSSAASMSRCRHIKTHFAGECSMSSCVARSDSADQTSLGGSLLVPHTHEINEYSHERPGSKTRNPEMPAWSLST